MTTETEIAEFQANLLMALYELEMPTEIRARLMDRWDYLQSAEDDMIALAAQLVKTWGQMDSSLG